MLGTARRAAPEAVGVVSLPALRSLDSLGLAHIGMEDAFGVEPMEVQMLRIPELRVRNSPALESGSVGLSPIHERNSPQPPHSH